MNEMQSEKSRTKLRAALTVIAVFMASAACAAWQISGTPKVAANANAMLHLLRTGGPENGPTSQTLWLSSSSTPEVIAPKTFRANMGQAFVPVFVRGEGNAWVTVLDSVDNSSSTVYLEAVRAPRADQSQAWLPHLKIDGEGELPVLIANQPTTAVLELGQGSGTMPPTTHISAIDHRGRLVLSQFYSTFDLTAGTAKITLPAAGEYTMTVKLLAEMPDQFPRARYRNPIPLAFGETVSKFEIPVAEPGTTTQTVVGTRIALEHLPTTSTIVAADRLRVIGVGRHSREMQRNRWPYVIAGADLIDMTRDQRYSEGAELLRWQRRLGSSFAPVNVTWSSLQKTPGSFQWATLGDTLSIYRKLMVRPLVTLMGRAAWNSQFPVETSATLTAWQTCVSEIADRFTPVMWGFYCWDHPENTWPDAAEYRKLLLATADGLQISEGKRRTASPLITGALAAFSKDYLDTLLTTDTLPRVAGIALDLFPKDPTGSPESNGFPEMLASIDNYISSLGQGKPELWISGTGWPAGPGGVSPELQANYLVRTHIMALAHNAAKITWYNLKDKAQAPPPAATPRWQPSGATGLLDSKNLPTLAGVAYALMTYTASGVSSPTITRQGDAHITSFNLPLQSNKWPGTLYVAWTDSPQKLQTVRLDMKHGGGVYAFDYLGAEIPTTKVAGDAADPITGTYTLPVGFEPVYIWDAGKAANGGA